MAQYQMKSFTGAVMEEALNMALDLQVKYSRGELNGAKGDTGLGIKNISRTAGNGTAGTYDTYTILMTDDTTKYTFKVYNGKDGTNGNGESGGTGAGSISVTDAYIDEGNLVLVLSNGGNITAGKVVGDKGDKGDKGDPGVGISSITNKNVTYTPGEFDTYTINFTDGTTRDFSVYNGANGSGDGSGTGANGVSVTDATINQNGELVITLSNGQSITTDKVVGEDGKDGVGVTGATVNSSGRLIITVSEGDPIDAGKVTGENGKDGVSITGATIDAFGNLVITFSEGEPISIGKVVGDDGAGIVSMFTHYGVSDSFSTKPTSWSSAFPSTIDNQGKYLWLRLSIFVSGDSATRQYYMASYIAKDGNDGVSPTISVTEISGGHQVSITDVNGSKSFNVMDGADGGSSSGSGSVSDTYIRDLIYPVGSIYMSVNSTSPSTLFGGTWTRIQDTFLLAAGSSYPAGMTGGSATVTLTENQIPAHTHDKGTYNITGQFQVRPYTGDGVNASVYGTGSNAFSSAGGSGETWARSLMGESNSKKTDVITLNASDSWTGSSGSAGAGEAHNNMPPYITVYMWKRTA